MIALHYQLRLIEPVLATQPHRGEANSGISLPYIPGSMIRGSLIRTWLASHQASNTDIVDEHSSERTLFFDEICFLNAYPVHPNTLKRLLPKPCAWFVEKDDISNRSAEVHDFASGDMNLDRPKPPAGDFCDYDSGSAILASPERLVMIHNASNNRNRKQAGDSQVYRYEALAKDQLFSGVIVSKNKAELEALENLLENHQLLLGGSHTGGYGLVSPEKIEIDTLWQGEYEEDEGVENPQKIVVTLLSDVLLRSESGQMSTDLFKALGIDYDPQTCELFQRTGVMGGFNRHWGLPLPQHWSVEAGTVLSIPFASDTYEKLQKKVEEGIGERRVDGFGRIAVNWHLASRFPLIAVAEMSLSPQEELKPLSHKLAQKMADRLLRLKLEQNLVSAIKATRPIKPSPSKTQLSRVRQVVRKAWVTNDNQAVAAFFQNMQGAREDWRNTKIGGKDLEKWLTKSSQLDEVEFKERFELTTDFPTIAGVEASLSETIRTEFCARHIDGILKVAIEAKKQSPNGDQA